MRNLVKRPIFWIILVIVFAVAVGMSACGDPAPRPLPVPVTCATWQAPDGTWMEEDNEEVDADPCDLDDVFEVRTTAPAKPLPKASPAKKPAPKTTRR